MKDRNGDQHLDQDGICDLHKAIGELQENYAMECDIRRSQDNLMSEVCKIIGASEDDDPAEIARARMDELRALEDLACVNCGEKPKSGVGAKHPNHCTQCATHQ